MATSSGNVEAGSGEDSASSGRTRRIGAALGAELKGIERLPGIRGFPWSRAAGGSARHPELKHLDNDRTYGERVADKVASFGGSWPFIFLFVGLMAAWMVANTVIIGKLAHGHAFDPFPYIALNLVLSALAGLQAPIIMMSQNRAAARDEALAAHHYEETQTIAELLRSNTDLTEQVHRLSERIHSLTGEVRAKLVGAPA